MQKNDADGINPGDVIEVDASPDLGESGWYRRPVHNKEIGNLYLFVLEAIAPGTTTPSASASATQAPSAPGMANPKTPTQTPSSIIVVQ